MVSRDGNSTHPGDDFARDRNGRPILDRFGRPVRRRTVPPSSQESPQFEHGVIPPSPRRPSATGSGGNNTPSLSGDALGGAGRPTDLPAASRPSPAERGHGERPASAPGRNSVGADGIGRYTPGAPQRVSRGRLRNDDPRATPRAPEYRRAENQSPYPGSTNSGYPGTSTGDRTGAHYPGNLGSDYPRDPNAHELLNTERPGAPRRTRPALRPPKLKTIAFLLFATLIALVALAGGTAIWVDGKLQRTEAIQKYDGRPGGGAGTNWLLVGSDSRAGLSEEDANRLMAGALDDTVGRTDTIMVVHVPSFGGQATMVSFPRDSWVDIPGHGQDKLNQAFSLGGPALLQQTIEKAANIRIYHYAEVGFGGFANIVDAVDGINMCLDEPLQDDMAGINLPAGCQTLDGPTALGFVRTRYTSANGDLDRVDRQKKFLSALSQKISSTDTVLNPFKSMKVIDTLASSTTVNKNDHVWNLAGLTLGMAKGPKQETVPVGGYMDTFAGNVVVWDEQAAEEMFAQLR